MVDIWIALFNLHITDFCNERITYLIDPALLYISAEILEDVKDY